MAAIHGRFTRSQILIQNGEWLLLSGLPHPSAVLLSASSRVSLCVYFEGLRTFQ